MNRFQRSAINLKPRYRTTPGDASELGRLYFNALQYSARRQCSEKNTHIKQVDVDHAVTLKAQRHQKQSAHVNNLCSRGTKRFPIFAPQSGTRCRHTLPDSGLCRSKTHHSAPGAHLAHVHHHMAAHIEIMHGTHRGEELGHASRHWIRNMKGCIRCHFQCL